ncbi:hypothetical protein [Gaoshiqia sp. Z1-71]|uniref:hypothetical protein n=1 Tax=Gaoshiqia hydrogeniformans TaxID=3290090 RepID=UPI003BF906F8
MEEWDKYFSEGLAYCKAATGAKEKNKLGNIVIYNTIGLALESLLMSVLSRSNKLPHHSTIGNMLREIKKLKPVSEEFFTEARFFNSFMNFCSLEVMAERVPTDDEITRMISFVVSLKEWAGKEVYADHESV